MNNATDGGIEDYRIRLLDGNRRQTRTNRLRQSNRLQENQAFHPSVVFPRRKMRYISIIEET